MVCMSGGKTPELIEFGPSHLETVPLLGINELPQVRI
jgi:hypothetical protein